MGKRMIIALSGTPGTGKTAVSEQLRKKGYKVIDINKIAQEQNFFTEYDRSRETHEVDLGGLNEYLRKELPELAASGSTPLFLEGHLAHLFDFIDFVIILRCALDVLQERLNSKNWHEKKILENLEAEALDVITIEAVEKYGEDKVFEVDTSNVSIDIVLEKIQKIIEGDTDEFKPGKIDWSEEILKWY
jgi:adenylate kinase